MNHQLRVKFLPHGEGLSTPAYATAGAVALDLHAAIPAEEILRIKPLERVRIPTGLIIAVPDGHEGSIRARSGRAYNEGLALINGVGTLDQDYRGEVFVAAINLSEWHINIRRGERVAQLVIAPITRVEVVVVTELDETARGAGGFGSTGR